jgi:hypothetical protein
MITAKVPGPSEHYNYLLDEFEKNNYKVVNVTSA